MVGSGTTLRWFVVLAAMMLAPAGLRAATDEATDPRRVELETALADFDEAQRIQAENPDRARQLFRAAAQRMEGVVAGGVVNGRLEYNLGNAHLQAGDLGRAILHYRRAARLIPGDPYLEDNLRLARDRRITDIKASQQSALLRNVFFLHYGTTTGARAKLALAAYVAMWGLWTAYTFAPRRWMVVSGVVAGLVCATLFTSVQVDRWSDANAPAGVLLASDVAVYKGPGEGYQRQFVQPLQAGVEFTVRERRGGWWRIELPDGQGGWVEAAGAQLVTG